MSSHVLFKNADRHIYCLRLLVCTVGCINPMHQLVWETKFSSVVPNVCRYSVLVT